LTSLPNAKSFPLVPFAPGAVIPHELSTPFGVTPGVLNLPAPNPPTSIIYQNANQNDVTRIQNFTNHTPCIE